MSRGNRRVDCVARNQTVLKMKMLKTAKKACHFHPDTVKYLLRGDVAQLVRALRSHRRGRGFEPLHPHQTKTTQWVVFCLSFVQRGSFTMQKAHRLGEISSIENAMHFLFFKISHVRADQQSVRWTVCPPRVAPPRGCAARSASSLQAKRRAPPSPPKTRVHQVMDSLFLRERLWLETQECSPDYMPLSRLPSARIAKAISAHHTGPNRNLNGIIVISNARTARMSAIKNGMSLDLDRCNFMVFPPIFCSRFEMFRCSCFASAALSSVTAVRFPAFVSHSVREAAQTLSDHPHARVIYILFFVYLFLLFVVLFLYLLYDGIGDRLIYEP